MSLTRLFVYLSIAWPIAVFATLMAVPHGSGSLSTYASWILVAGAPGAIALLITRNQPARSVSQVIQDTEHPADKPTATAARG